MREDKPILVVLKTWRCSGMIPGPSMVSLLLRQELPAGHGPAEHVEHAVVRPAHTQGTEAALGEGRWVGATTACAFCSHSKLFTRPVC